MSELIDLFMKPKCFLLCICNDKYNILSIYYMFIEAGDLSVGLTGLYFLHTRYNSPQVRDHLTLIT